ncbi:unnamed protein product, partial [Rotaria socialis]
FEINLLGSGPYAGAPYAYAGGAAGGAYGAPYAYAPPGPYYAPPPPGHLCVCD